MKKILARVFGSYEIRPPERWTARYNDDLT